VLGALREAGLGSPAAVAEAGVEKLGTLERVGARAVALHEAAAAWVAAHAPAPAEPEADAEAGGGTEDAAAAEGRDARGASAPE
jgi:hypothetical protein